MASITRTTLLIAWVFVVGTIAGTAQASSGARERSADNCFIIDGVIYCPCEEALECMPPNCVIIDGDWFCRAD
jgi:hypothetical protein